MRERVMGGGLIRERVDGGEGCCGRGLLGESVDGKKG
jgi:hypothetical protein